MVDNGRKRLKAINDRIYRSATQRKFFGELLERVRASIVGDPQAISDIVGSMLGSAIWALAHDEPFDIWKSQAEVSLICLGGIEMDLQGFYSMVKGECHDEISACFYAETTYRMGGDIDIIEEEVSKMLGDERDEAAPNYDDDHDPLNGRYVNAEHEKMLLAYDKACEEKNQAEQDRISKEVLVLLKREAAKESPLAMFYLGVSYCNGSGVEKNLPKAKDLLAKAKTAGVERAETFLSMYFGDPDDGKIIPARLEDFEREYSGDDKPDWMFPNGHNEGEAIDTMPWDKE